MFRPFQSLVALVAVAAAFALPTRAIADSSIFPEDVIEVHLSVGSSVVGFPEPGQGFWSTYPIDGAPTYAIISGSAPGLDVTPLDEPADPDVYRGVNVVGTPTDVGVYTFEVEEVTTQGTVPLTLNIYVYADDSTRDAVIYYTTLAYDAVGYETYYWAALRGYYAGVGLNDEASATYEYNAYLGLYFYSYYLEQQQPELAYFYYFSYQGEALYQYYASTEPGYAAYYYFYNQALAYYSYYYSLGDTETAVYFYILYMGYADASL